MYTDPQRQRAAAAGYRVRNQKLKIDLKGTHNLRPELSNRTSYESKLCTLKIKAFGDGSCLLLDFQPLAVKSVDCLHG